MHRRHRRHVAQASDRRRHRCGKRQVSHSELALIAAVTEPATPKPIRPPYQIQAAALPRSRLHRFHGRCIVQSIPFFEGIQK
jgi:hypothetical protein